MLEMMGGYRRVAPRVGMAATTLHSHMMANVLPAKFYLAFCTLAAEQGQDAPEPGLFGFVTLRSRKADAQQKDAA